MIALDNGLENPQFACLEIEYGENDDPSAAVVSGQKQKRLVVYEVDLGLNHVIRKFAESVPETAHALISVPGGDDQQGPCGVLIACENFFIYKKKDHEERRCTLPIRVDQSTEQGVFITCH